MMTRLDAAAHTVTAGVALQALVWPEAVDGGHLVTQCGVGAEGRACMPGGRGGVVSGASTSPGMEGMCVCLYSVSRDTMAGGRHSTRTQPTTCDL